MNKFFNNEKVKSTVKHYIKDNLGVFCRFCNDNVPVIEEPSIGEYLCYHCGNIIYSTIIYEKDKAYFVIEGDHLQVFYGDKLLGFIKPNSGIIFDGLVTMGWKPPPDVDSNIWIANLDLYGFTRKMAVEKPEPVLKIYLIKNISINNKNKDDLFEPGYSELTFVLCGTNKIQKQLYYSIEEVKNEN